MKPETNIRGRKVLAMLNTLQAEIDDLSSDGLFFRHELKMAGKNFIRELEKQIKDLYGNMNPEAEQLYYDEVKKLEELLKYHFTEHYQNKQA